MKNLRLYSPAKVTAYAYDVNRTCYDIRQSEVYDDVEYFEVIKEKIKNYTERYGKEYNERGLMGYFDGDGEVYDSILKKVESAFPSVTVLTDKWNYKKLFGVCDLKVNGELTKKELKVLYEYLESSYSDGIGESMEQEDIKVDIRSEEREIQMHFWERGSFYIQNEEEIKNDGYTDLYPLEEEEVVEQDYSNDNDFEMTM